MRRPIKSRWFWRQGSHQSPFVSQDTWTHPLLPQSSWVGITRTWSRTLKGVISHPRLMLRQVPTRCPWGAHNCALFLKRPKLRAQTDSLSMIYSPQDLHGRHHRCRIHLSPGVSTPWAVGCRISAFSVHSRNSRLAQIYEALGIFKCVVPLN